MVAMVRFASVISFVSSTHCGTATEHEHASTEHCYRACVIQYFS